MNHEVVLREIESLIQATRERNNPNPTHPESTPQYAYVQTLDFSEAGEYTISAACPQLPPVKAESTGDISSKAPSTIFDCHSECSTDLSSAPSRVGEQPLFLQRPPVPSPAPSVHQIHNISGPGQFLPCELSGFGCQERFPLHRVADWIWHLETDHLRDAFPSNSICWFCNSQTVDEFKSASDSDEDRKSAFRRRMHHIAEHYVQGVTRGPRPDWFLLCHLVEIRAIAQDQFNEASKYTERPVCAGTITINRTPPAQRQPSYMAGDQGQYYRKRVRSKYVPREGRL